MKTPKRYPATMSVYATLQDLRNDRARWKRKNRVRKLKNTIAMLRYRLKDTEDCLRFTQKQTKFFLVRPDHWHPRDENGNELTRKEWRRKKQA